MASEQPDYSGSAMIACYPAAGLARSLALRGGLEPEELHLTVAYVGDAADVDLPALVTAAASLIGRPALEAQISGHARFTRGEQDVLVALIDSPAIEQLRRDVVDALRENDVPLPSEHGFTAHTTLRYLSPDDPSPIQRLDPAPVRFDALSVVHGNTRIDLPFTPPRAKETATESAVREAYAAGWAASGGPMTDRVRAGCAAAIDLGRAYPGDVRVVEAALQLGSLEGTWALIYRRRDELMADHVGKAVRAWKMLITRPEITDAVADFHRRIGPRESAAEDTQRQDETKAAALAAASAMIQALPGDPAWSSIRTALRNALAAGRAEGVVGAVAIAAERAGQVGLNWDIAFEHAYASLENLDALWPVADDWLSKMLDRATADLGRALADGARDSASYAQLLADAMDAIDSDDVDAVSFIVDWAMQTALSQGALALYASEGVAGVDWITAGDGRVCPICEDCGDGSPYALADFPGQPAHPRCRCASAANLDLSNFAVWFTP